MHSSIAPPLRGVALLSLIALLSACGSGDGAPVDPSNDGGTDADDASTSDAPSDEGPPTDAADGATDAASDGGDVATDADVGPDIPVKLPGSIPGVEPEAHAHHPPMIDGKGALYRVTESTKADGNRPRMMKSADSGATWAEVDASKRPSPTDLEGCWQLQVGSTIYLSVANTDRVWFTAFNTSDATDKPDQWVLDEKVENDLGNAGGVVQFSSIARTPDGQFWLFYSDTMVSGRQQIGYRRRAVAGTWSAKQRIGETTGSWTGPRALSGASGVTHVFYKDHLAHRLLWRTLSATGTLADAKRIDTSGTSSERLPHTNAVRYESGGTETIVIAFATKSGHLKAVTLTNGAIGSEENVSSDPVLQNPSIALNDGAVAHLAVDGTTVHALWSDAASGDIKHSLREHGKAWTTPTTVWSSGPSIAWWVYGNVYVRGGRRRLGYTYDIGVHADDVGNIAYNEITLGLP